MMSVLSFEMVDSDEELNCSKKEEESVGDAEGNIEDILPTFEKKTPNESDINSNDIELSCHDNELEEGEITDSNDNSPKKVVTSGSSAQKFNPVLPPEDYVGNSGCYKPLVVCRHFQRGTCFFGTNCRFIHVTHNTTKIFDTRNFSEITIVVPKQDLNAYSSIFPSCTSSVAESWDKGLEEARKLVLSAKSKKETDVDFEEKKLYMDIDSEKLVRNKKRSVQQMKKVNKHKRHESSSDDRSRSCSLKRTKRGKSKHRSRSTSFKNKKRENYSIDRSRSTSLNHTQQKKSAKHSSRSKNKKHKKSTKSAKDCSQSNRFRSCEKGKRNHEHLHSRNSSSCTRKRHKSRSLSRHENRSRRSSSSSCSCKSSYYSLSPSKRDFPKQKSKLERVFSRTFPKSPSRKRTFSPHSLKCCSDTHGLSRHTFIKRFIYHSYSRSPVKSFNKLAKSGFRKDAPRHHSHSFSRSPSPCISEFSKRYPKKRIPRQQNRNYSRSLLSPLGKFSKNNSKKEVPPRQRSISKSPSISNGKFSKWFSKKDDPHVHKRTVLPEQHLKMKNSLHESKNDRSFSPFSKLLKKNKFFPGWESGSSDITISSLECTSLSASQDFSSDENIPIKDMNVLRSPKHDLSFSRKSTKDNSFNFTNKNERKDNYFLPEPKSYEITSKRNKDSPETVKNSAKTSCNKKDGGKITKKDKTLAKPKRKLSSFSQSSKEFSACELELLKYISFKKRNKILETASKHSSVNYDMKEKSPFPKSITKEIGSPRRTDKNKSEEICLALHENEDLEDSFGESLLCTETGNKIKQTSPSQKITGDNGKLASPIHNEDKMEETLVSPSCDKLEKKTVAPCGSDESEISEFSTGKYYEPELSSTELDLLKYTSFRDVGITEQLKKLAEKSSKKVSKTSSQNVSKTEATSKIQNATRTVLKPKPKIVAAEQSNRNLEVSQTARNRPVASRTEKLKQQLAAVEAAIAKRKKQVELELLKMKAREKCGH